jgi:hypothetical protein
MCQNANAAEVLRQKFGYQRAEFYTGLSEAQKSLNQFQHAVYFPTNWRNNQIPNHAAKFPQFIRYGSLTPVAPEWFQRNYQGVYSIKQQPTVNEPDAFTLPRFS